MSSSPVVVTQIKVNHQGGHFQCRVSLVGQKERFFWCHIVKKIVLERFYFFSPLSIALFFLFLPRITCVFANFDCSDCKIVFGWSFNLDKFFLWLALIELFKLVKCISLGRGWWGLSLKSPHPRYPKSS